MPYLGRRDKLPDDHPLKGTSVIVGYRKPTSYDAWKKRREQEAEAAKYAAWKKRREQEAEATKKNGGIIVLGSK